MAQVARVAGVSISTVSHVVNHTRYVAPDTARAVQEAITRTGYTPDPVARALVTSSTRSIGFAISVMSNPYFGELVHAVEEATSSAGYTLLLADTHDDPAHEARAVDALLARRIDAMLLAPTGQARVGVLPRLAEAGVPTVLIDRLADPGLDQVGVDNAPPVAALVQHLADLGHRRIAMIYGLAGLSTSDERLAGYRAGLRRAGLPLDQQLVRHGASRSERAASVTHELLALPDPPTAIFAANNAMTIGVLRALRQAGRRVPDEVALAAFDDFEWTDLFSPRLTTIAQPCQDMGATAVALLLSRLVEPTLPPRTVRLPAAIHHGESCGCRTGSATVIVSAVR